MRCQRTRISCNVLLKAWPMCRLPVTFGGGIITENASAPATAFATARPTLRSIQSFEMRASASAALKVFSIGICGFLESTAFLYPKPRGRPSAACIVHVAKMPRSPAGLALGRTHQRKAAAAPVMAMGDKGTARHLGGIMFHATSGGFDRRNRLIDRGGPEIHAPGGGGDTGIVEDAADVAALAGNDVVDHLRPHRLRARYRPAKEHAVKCQRRLRVCHAQIMPVAMPRFLLVKRAAHPVGQGLQDRETCPLGIEHHGKAPRVWNIRGRHDHLRAKC